MAIHHRLKHLQRKARELAPSPPQQWSTDDQLDDVLHVLNFHQRFRTCYEATDREINLLVMWCIYEAHADEPEAVRELTGEVTLPHSGALVRWTKDISAETVDLALYNDSPIEALIEDLPEPIRAHVERMPIAYQKERELFLYNYWLQRRAQEPEQEPAG